MEMKFKFMRLINTENFYGMRIIPEYNENNVEGIIIHTTSTNFENIEIVKIEKNGKDYNTILLISIPLKESHAHRGSGKDYAEFLSSKAKNFSKNNEFIGITEELAAYIILLDITSEHIKKMATTNNY